MRKQAEISLLQKLKTVRRNVKEEELRGQVVRQAICYRLIDLDLEPKELNILYRLFTAWPKSTGDTAFPVPSPDPERNRLTMYTYASAQGTIWTGEYGALRMELLEWMIAQLENVDE